VFDAIAGDVKKDPLLIQVEPIASLLRAILILLGKLHERGIAYGDKPENCLLSSVKNGHGMTWPAWIEFNGQKFAVELGSAAHSMEQDAEYHTEACKIMDGNLRRKARLSRVDPKKKLGSRVSGRTHNNCSLSPGCIQAMLRDGPLILTGSDVEVPQQGGLDCCGGISCGKQAQALDIRRLARAIGCLLSGGKIKQGVWGFKGETAEQLLEYIMKEWDLREIFGSEPSEDRQKFWADEFGKLPHDHQSLLQILTLMLTHKAPNAEALLKDDLMQNFDVKPSEYPEGLESAPEELRDTLRKCKPLMKSIASKNLHYYVKGQDQYPWKGRLIKIHGVWLVYTLKPDGSGWSRSVRIAEEGKKGDGVARYMDPWIRDPCPMRDTRHMHQLPCNRDIQMDGKPRGREAAPKAVENMAVGCFLDSCKSATGELQDKINCKREWSHHWVEFGTDKYLGSLDSLKDVYFMLVLKHSVKAYDNLLYDYDWNNNEKKFGKSVETALAAQGGGRRQKVRPFFAPWEQGTGSGERERWVRGRDTWIEGGKDVAVRARGRNAFSSLLCFLSLSLSVTTAPSPPLLPNSLAG
jgi:hypothetical protein